MEWSSFDLSRDAKTAIHGQSILAEVPWDKGKGPTSMLGMRKTSGGEQRAEKFWKDYSIPDGVDIKIPADPTTVEDTTLVPTWLISRRLISLWACISPCQP